MIITSHKMFFVDRCEQRGVSVLSAMGCVVSQSGDVWEIDTEHADYPKPLAGRGPGTELKKILARVGIVATPDCSCTQRAAEMDRNGCEWVEANMSPWWAGCGSKRRPGGCRSWTWQGGHWCGWRYGMPGGRLRQPVNPRGRRRADLREGVYRFDAAGVDDPRVQIRPPRYSVGAMPEVCRSIPAGSC